MNNKGAVMNKSDIEQAKFMFLTCKETTERKCIQFQCRYGAWCVKLKKRPREYSTVKEIIKELEKS